MTQSDEAGRRRARREGFPKPVDADGPGVHRNEDETEGAHAARSREARAARRAARLRLAADREADRIAVGEADVSESIEDSPAPAPEADGGKRRRKKRRDGAASEDAPAPAVAPPAAQASMRPRHRLTALSFVLLVVAPTLASVGYLYVRAADQYASRVAFSIRGNENTSPISFLGALSQTVTVGGADAEIVYALVQSQQMVEAARDALPLEEMFNRPERDVVFRLGEGRPIEDLTEYWNWMTSVSFDAATGLVEFEARAFDPEDARAISGFVLDESTRIVNAISEQAREDAVAVARSVLEEAEERLRAIRREIRAFRDAEQELDPSQNARAALELIAGLRQQLAQANVELDSYLQLVGPQGPRAPALRQRIESIESRIAEERRRVGAGAEETGTAEGRLFSELVGDFEELAVELEFAQNAYVSALSAFEQAQVEARRQTRFLSPHIHPTLSMEPQHPRRALLSVAVFVGLLVAWSVGLLITYNIRDRR